MSASRIGVRSALLLGLALLGIAPSPSASARLSGAELFGDPTLVQVELSPSGSMLAIVETRDYVEHVIVQRLSDGARVEAPQRFGRSVVVVWVDDRHLLVAERTTKDVQGAQEAWTEEVVRFRDAIQVSERDDGTLAIRDREIRARGKLVQVVPGGRGEVLWSHGYFGESSVFRVPMRDLLEISGHAVRMSGDYEKVATLKGAGIDRWVADGQGVPRAAVAVHPPDVLELWLPAQDGRWRRVLESEDVETFPFPRGVSKEGRLLVLSRGEGDTVALYEFDTRTLRLGREVFRDPDFDVIGVVHDHAGAANGVVIEREGLEERRHFDESYSRHQRSLEEALPGRAIAIAGASHDQRMFLVRTQGPRDPGTYYVLDTSRGQTQEIGRTMPWLDPERLHPVEALSVTSQGVQIEAFLSRPRAVSPERPAPLVVLPHGGPRGIRDTRVFSPLVQYLTDGGFAVLQVNYRGSAGRGLSFLESGSQEWGKGIEDDIEATLAVASDREWIDGDRVCIAGGSYGGYSALISVVRNPKRYRCAASINGPTDLAFDYYSHFTYWEEGKLYFQQHIGDVGDYDALIELSPAYRVADIEVPVLLVHGTEDERVPLDHYHRMRNMLVALKKPHEAVLIFGGGHVPDAAQWVEIASRLRVFLKRNLAAPPR